MKLVEFAENELIVELSHLQKDFLELLEVKGELFYSLIKPETEDTKKVIDIYHKWLDSRVLAVC
ncbi:hypothetical protein EBB07_29050 [Paenibacillaceae bacterium]|nr:hypothetical protein EBB07_29050 [Paenibacillaceae bacterium]